MSSTLFLLALIFWNQLRQSWCKPLAVNRLYLQYLTTKIPGVWEMLFSEADAVAEEIRFAVQRVAVYTTVQEALDAGGTGEHPAAGAAVDAPAGVGAGLVLTTLEGLVLVLEVSEAGYLVVSSEQLATPATESALPPPSPPAANSIFESMESLLSEHSPLYRKAFANALFVR